MYKTFVVKGMKCLSCVKAIQEGLDKVGLKNASVSLNPPEITFINNQVSKEVLQASLDTIGDYKIVSTKKNELLNEKESKNYVHEEEKQNFTPLIVILLYLFGGVVLTSIISNNFSPHTMMINFMGGFFVLFSLFKMINITGFADAFATYDILAARSRLYGLTYPFIELALGIAYIARYLTNTIHIITLILMLIGSVGVYKALKTNRQFQCACLGTSLKLPMTKITLIEDLIMGLMAFAMLVM